MLHICTVCGYQYDDDVEMKPFNQMPDDWHCPVCNAPKSAFTSMAKDYSEGDG